LALAGGAPGRKICGSVGAARNFPSGADIGIDMEDRFWRSMFRRCTLAVAVTAVLGGCATPPAPSAPAPTVAETRPAVVPAEPPPAPVEVSPAASKAQAQKLAIEAVEQLQSGDEASARVTLERALTLDSGNELARKLNEQIKADAQKELGPAFFRYTVQRDDSLSKLAQQYLGDRFRFYILAKYNEMPIPSRLAAGQVIKIPGRAPVVAKPADVVEAKPAAGDGDSKVRDEVADALRKGKELEAAGNLEGAYAAYNDAVTRFPGNAEVVGRRNAARAALIQFYDREGTQAFQRQNLALAITKWDRILEIDPANKKAKLERERAVDLQKRMSERFGAK
jgi:Tfp pilus assembly protein PilF